MIVHLPAVACDVASLHTIETSAALRTRENQIDDRFESGSIVFHHIQEIPFKRAIATGIKDHTAYAFRFELSF